jgi:hypothetical protein
MANVKLTSKGPEHANSDYLMRIKCLFAYEKIAHLSQDSVRDLAGGRRRDRRRSIMRKVWKVRKEDSDNGLTKAPYFINGPGMSACLLVSDYFTCESTSTTWRPGIDEQVDCIQGLSRMNSAQNSFLAKTA